MIKDELIAKHPDLAADVFNAFAESKRQYVAKLKAGQIEKPTEVDKVHQRVMEITGDPLPYGIEPNRKVIEELLRHAHNAGHHHQAGGGRRLFAPCTRGLAGSVHRAPGVPAIQSASRTWMPGLGPGMTNREN